MIRKLKAFRLQIGDTVMLGKAGESQVDSIEDIDRDTIRVRYTNGSIGIYPRRNEVSIITKNRL